MCLLSELFRSHGVIFGQKIEAEDKVKGEGSVWFNVCEVNGIRMLDFFLKQLMRTDMCAFVCVCIIRAYVFACPLLSDSGKHNNNNKEPGQRTGGGGGGG